MKKRMNMKTILVVWAVAAVALSFAPFPPIAIPIVLVGLVATGLALRRSADAIAIRTLVLVQVVRAFIGAAFLVLHHRGALPAEFAVRGGIGDIVVGLTAIPVAFSSSRKVLLGWNLFGLVDLALVVMTAQKLAFIDHDPLQSAAMTTFPFPLLPFFVVPLMALSHLVIFERTLKAPTPASRRA